MRERSHHPATAWVDLDRVRDNFRALRTYAGPRAVIPVLKANAYGHGAVAIARALELLDAPMFAVAYVDEAIVLRESGITTPLLVLTGFAPRQLSLIQKHRLTPVISTREQVLALEALPSGLDSPLLPVHVKVDTGMARLGFPLQEIEPVIHRLEDAEAVSIDGLMTHLASADEDQLTTNRQLDVFDEAIVRLQTLGVRPPWIHAANSAGMMSTRENHTAVRPGLLLYGVKPQPLSPDISVNPALEFRVRVAHLKTVAAGTPVSYGGKFVAQRTSRIATLSAGYADGIPRTDAMRERGVLRHGGDALKVAGTVCMDLTMVDATDAPGLSAGDEVTVWGAAPTAWEVARWAGTNAWQVLTAVGPRVPRRYTLGGEIVGEDLQPEG